MSGLPEAVVVFGASGFVGRNLVNRLVGEVETLIAVTASGRSVPGCSATYAMNDLSRLPDLPTDTAVVHLAAFRYDAGRFDLAQSDIVQANAELNSRIFHFCAERRITEMRLASSVAVYGGDLAVMDDEIPIDLNSLPHQNEAFYAWSKRWAEILADLYQRRFSVQSIVLRLSNPYGPYDSTNPAKAHVAPAFVMKALSADPVFAIRGDAAVERDFTYVGDVVEVIARTLRWRGRHEKFNLCTGRTLTLRELAEAALRCAGVEKPIEAGAPGAFGPAKRVSRGDRIRAATGVEFCSLEEGLRPTVEWYRHALGA